MPRDISWAQTLGAASLTAFIVQAVTGVFLAMYYKPDPDNAYASIQNITEEVTLGWLVRGMHKWGASIFIILMFFHMARTFLFGAYKYPRELNWVIGVLILVLGMLEGFTGYLLPWDNTAYWATVVGINLNAHRTVRRAVPRAVPPGRAEHQPRHALEVLRPAHAAGPGRDHGADRAAPVPRGAPRRHLAAVVGDGRRPRAARGRRAAGRPDPRPRSGAPPAAAEGEAGPDGRPAEGAEPRGAQALQGGRRARGQELLPVRDLPRHGHVAARRRGRSSRSRASGTTRRDATEAGILGPWYTDEADPGTIQFVPRPDWFFYFLFYLLRIFKWPETVVLGTVGVPTLLLILLIGLPFYDRRPERRLGKRPVALVAAILVVISMGVLTWKGATAKEALGSEIIAAGTIDEWAEAAGLRRQRGGRRGRDPLRAVGLPQLPHLPRRGQLEPRRARPDAMSARPTAASTSSSRTSRTRRSTGTT